MANTTEIQVVTVGTGGIGLNTTGSLRRTAASTFAVGEVGIDSPAGAVKYSGQDPNSVVFLGVTLLGINAGNSGLFVKAGNVELGSGSFPVGQIVYCSSAGTLTSTPTPIPVGTVHTPTNITVAMDSFHGNDVYAGVVQLAGPTEVPSASNGDKVLTLDYVATLDGSGSSGIVAHEAAYDHTLIHTQGTDTLLDSGQPNQVTSSELRNHLNDNVIHITGAERTTWNNKSDFSGSYNDLSNLPDLSGIGVSHIQGSDLTLDVGNPNEVTAIDLRSHLDDASIHIPNAVTFDSTGVWTGWHTFSNQIVFNGTIVASVQSRLNSLLVVSNPANTAGFDIHQDLGDAIMENTESGNILIGTGGVDNDITINPNGDIQYGSDVGGKTNLFNMYTVMESTPKSQLTLHTTGTMQVGGGSAIFLKADSTSNLDRGGVKLASERRVEDNGAADFVVRNENTAGTASAEVMRVSSDGNLTTSGSINGVDLLTGFSDNASLRANGSYSTVEELVARGLFGSHHISGTYWIRVATRTNTGYANGIIEVSFTNGSTSTIRATFQVIASLRGVAADGSATITMLSNDTVGLDSESLIGARVVWESSNLMHFDVHVNIPSGGITLSSIHVRSLVDSKWVPATSAVTNPAVGTLKAELVLNGLEAGTTSVWKVKRLRKDVLNSTDAVDAEISDNHLINASAGSVTVMVNDPADSVGSEIMIMKIDSDLNTVSVTPRVPFVINGSAANIVLSNQYDYIKLISDGSNWFITGSRPLL